MSVEGTGLALISKDTQHKHTNTNTTKKNTNTNPIIYRAPLVRPLLVLGQPLQQLGEARAVERAAARDRAAELFVF